MSRDSKDSLLPKKSSRNPHGDSTCAASMTDPCCAAESSARPEAKGASRARLDFPAKHAKATSNPVAEEAERYLTVRDVARRFAVSVQTVWRWAKERPQFPKPVELSPGTTRWRMSDLIAFERGLSGDVR